MENLFKLCLLEISLFLRLVFFKLHEQIRIYSLYSFRFHLYPELYGMKSVRTTSYRFVPLLESCQLIQSNFNGQ